jgi:N-terminal domain of anti-restriction factor ArdC
MSTATEDRVAAHLAVLQSSVTELVTGEQWQRYLSLQSRFHTYSFWNTLAILRARPDATKLAGFHQWRHLGRNVRKGEHGIAILAPIVHTIDRSQPNSTVEADEDEHCCVAFKVVYVFDVAQTDGDPLPEPPMPETVNGDAPVWLWQTVAEQITAAGYRLERAPIPDPWSKANGITLVEDRHVIVRHDLPDAQAIKTCTHELAHVLLHTDPHGALSRPGREVEAESVAFIVCSAAGGMDTAGYTFPYVAHWSGGDPALVAACGERVAACARGILDRVGQGHYR